MPSAKICCFASVFFSAQLYLLGDAAAISTSGTDQHAGAEQSMILSVAPEAAAQVDALEDYPVYRDAALEARLDALIEVGFYPPEQDEFHQILDSLDSSTPLDTYIRAQSYRAYELVMRDGDFAAAHELVRQMKQRVDGAGALEASLEVLMTETQLHLQGNDLPAAMARTIRIDELSRRV